MPALFIFDSLSGFFICLLLLVGIPSLLYARMQLKGTISTQFSPLLLQMSCLLLLLGVLAISNTLFFFTILWSWSPILLGLMIMSFRSKESDYSAWQAFLYLEGGALILFSCQLILPTGATWSQINMLPITPQIEISLCLIILACVIQSGLFPAHRWLMNSLSAPTAVSALMHAGFINASGLLLLRMTPLLARSYLASLLLLCFGALSIMMGTLMSAAQVEQKRALACSTVAQMGCIFVYTALGLQSLVAAHLLTHAMYKAYSFLGMGFALQGSSYNISRPDSLLAVTKGLIGALIAVLFAYGLANFPPQSETVFAIFLAYLGYQIGGAQLPGVVGLIICALSGFTLMLWHQLFATILPVVSTPLGGEAVAIVLLAAAMIAYAPYLPISWQGRLYSYVVKLSAPDAKALSLSRKSAVWGALS